MTSVLSASGRGRFAAVRARAPRGFAGCDLLPLRPAAERLQGSHHRCWLDRLLLRRLRRLAGPGGPAERVQPDVFDDDGRADGLTELSTAGRRAPQRCHPQRRHGGRQRQPVVLRQSLGGVGFCPGQRHHQPRRRLRPGLRLGCGQQPRAASVLAHGRQRQSQPRLPPRNLHRFQRQHQALRPAGRRHHHRDRLAGRAGVRHPGAGHGQRRAEAHHHHHRRPRRVAGAAEHVGQRRGRLLQAEGRLPRGGACQRHGDVYRVDAFHSLHPEGSHRHAELRQPRHPRGDAAGHRRGAAAGPARHQRHQRR